MKSVTIQQPEKLVIEERPVPQPQPGEVRIRVSSAGICGSDVHIYRGHNPFAKYPRVIGHEFFGHIDAVGEGVESSRIGERVVGVHRDGGFSEYVTLPANNALLMPEVRDRDLSVLEDAAETPKSQRAVKGLHV